MNEHLANPHEDQNLETEFFQLGPLQEMLERRLIEAQQPLGSSALRAVELIEEQ